MTRISGRNNDEERAIKLTPNFTSSAEGCVLAETQRTRVICSVSIESNVPSWMKGSGKGWLTAEYGMLPKCSKTRISREKHLSSGRTKEIQRLIGRSLRSAVDLDKLGEKTIIIDCDVIEADGGTRTTAINGAMAALALAFVNWHEKGLIKTSPISDFIGAISVGIVKGEVLSDLEYAEDSEAEVDMNIVMNSKSQFIEVQGCAERKPFSKERLDELIELAKNSINRVISVQKSIFSTEQIEWLLGKTDEIQ